MSSVSVEALQRHLDFLERQVGELRKENFLLKRTVKGFLATHLLPLPDEISLDLPPNEPNQTMDWASRAEKFKPLMRAIVEVVEAFVQETGRCASYDDIIPILEKNPKYRLIVEAISSDRHGTITARCRDLRRAGYLSTPEGEQALFQPGPRRLVA